MSELMNAKTSAQFLGISRWLVYELAKKGQIPHVRLGNRVLFRKEALIIWMEALEKATSL